MANDNPRPSEQATGKTQKISAQTQISRFRHVPFNWWGSIPRNLGLCGHQVLERNDGAFHKVDLWRLERPKSASASRGWEQATEAGPNTKERCLCVSRAAGWGPSIDHPKVVPVAYLPRKRRKEKKGSGLDTQLGHSASTPEKRKFSKNTIIRHTYTYVYAPVTYLYLSLRPKPNRHKGSTERSSPFCCSFVLALS